jgi:primosomal protein N' (replication factor Y)
VRTKALLRLARDEPVLTADQMRLAAWIAFTYVAPIAEAVRLLLPPGLLQSSPERLGARVKREQQIALVAGPQEVKAALLAAARSTPDARLLAWFLAHPHTAASATLLRKECALTTAPPLERLVAAGVLALDEAGQYSVIGDESTLVAALDDAQGLARYRRPLAILAEVDRPLWRDELYARWGDSRPSTSTALLRDLEAWGLISVTERVRFRDPLEGREYRRSHAPLLTGEQAAAWALIHAQGFGAEGDAVSNSDPAARRFLLHGVTGSGKTEIYLRAIEETLARGKQVIVLIPEIALAPQTVARFAGRFPGRVTVIHSALNQGERYDVWRALRAGEFDIVVGPRSALFAPMPSLGLVVIDEEHESSYKQDAEEWGSRAVFYDARTVARRLTEISGSVLIMGSATPSLEAYAEAMQGGATLIALPQRVVGHAPTAAEGAAAEVTAYGGMPPVEIVDMRQELRAGNRSIFSRSLQNELRATLEAGEQAIFFLNRRGTNTFVMCRDCGYVAECPSCEIPLVYHEGVSQLVCHRCNARTPIPERCPTCQSARIRYFGSGTEQIERRVREVAPNARLLRWDADTTSARGSHEAILQRFVAHEADVLVGTQMIAKGLDLPLVTLVGVVAADVGLHLPDFRSGERAFQLLTQVAGRAGRSRRGGRVVIQSYTPEHYAIQAAAAHDYHAFYKREMAFRREQGYPPLRRMARLVFWEKNPQKARKEPKRLAVELKAAIKELELEEEVHLFGPAPAFFARSRGYYRWQLLLLADDPAAIVRHLDFPHGWRVDIDPVTTL